MNTIITPTFIGHFQFIKVYLEAFCRNAIIDDGWQIVFTVGADEADVFDEVITPYKSKLPIRVLIFEDILKRYGIKANSRELIEKYGKFTFQTLKKYYSMLATDSEYFLVLDSESMPVNNFDVNDLFQKFFERREIFYSDNVGRCDFSRFTSNVIRYRNIILGTHDSLWFIEGFGWFYKKDILERMFQEHGTPIEMAERVVGFNTNAFSDAGLFEIDLYQRYVYENRDKLGYRAINVRELMKQYLTENQIDKYYQSLNRVYKGNCGVLEHSMMLLTHENIDGLSRMFADNEFSIIRCNRSTITNYKLQSQFMKVVQPKILAASQDHIFGYLEHAKRFARRNRYHEKLHRYLDPWKRPVKKVLNFIANPFIIVGCGIMWLITYKKLLKMVEKNERV